MAQGGTCDLSKHPGVLCVPAASAPAQGHGPVHQTLIAGGSPWQGTRARSESKPETCRTTSHWEAGHDGGPVLHRRGESNPCGPGCAGKTVSSFRFSHGASALKSLLPSGDKLSFPPEDSAWAVYSGKAPSQHPALCPAPHKKPQMVTHLLDPNPASSVGYGVPGWPRDAVTEVRGRTGLLQLWRMAQHICTTTTVHC